MVQSGGGTNFPRGRPYAAKDAAKPWPSSALHSLFDVSSECKASLLRRLGVAGSLADVMQLESMEARLAALLCITRVHCLSKARRKRGGEVRSRPPLLGQLALG